MTFTKQNNPVVIGLLIVSLGGALVGVYQQIKHVQAAIIQDNAAHKPTVEAAPAPSGDARVVVDSFQRPGFAHDPFQSPPLKQTIEPIEAPHQPVTMPVLPSVSTEPLTIRPLPSTAPTSTVSTAVTATSPAVAPAAPSGVDIKSLHVTAIMNGARATAIIERDGHDPAAVGVGGHIAGYKVAAIGSDGVILSNDTGIYTISLASAANSQDGDQDSQTTAPGKPSATMSAQETANVAH